MPPYASTAASKRSARLNVIGPLVEHVSIRAANSGPAPPARARTSWDRAGTIEEFDGACDPAFDNDLDEMERQFAEYRLSLANDQN